MKSKFKISIVIGTYNRENFITSCLNSVLNQNFAKYQVIVVDDFSKDNTPNLVRKFIKSNSSKLKQKNAAIKLIQNKKNKGVAGTRNAGIRAASGEIIAFMDDDCIADEDWLSNIYKSYHDNKIIAAGGISISAPPKNMVESAAMGSNFIAAKSGKVTHLVGCNMSFKKDFLKKNKFDETLKYGFEELDLCTRARNQGYEIFYNQKAKVMHHHRSTLKSLIRQHFNNGIGATWYNKKHGLFFMAKNKLFMLISLLNLFMALVNGIFFIVSAFFFILYIVSILIMDTKSSQKSLFKTLLYFPIVFMIYFAEFLGALAGIYRFYLKK